MTEKKKTRRDQSAPSAAHQHYLRNLTSLGQGGKREKLEGAHLFEAFHKFDQEGARTSLFSILVVTMNALNCL